MSQIEINNNAKEELEAIISDLFINKIDAKLNEKISTLSVKIDDKSIDITKKIGDVSMNINKKIEDDIEAKLEDLKSESEDLLKITGENNNTLNVLHSNIDEYSVKNNEGIESIQIKLSEIQNEYLADILSNALKIIENQKTDSEDFLLKLDSVIKLQTENIISDSSDNRELVKKTQADLQSNIVTLFNENGLNQKKNIQDLAIRISDFVDLENENNLNLHKQLDTKFQTAEQLNSALTRDFDEKLKSLKTDNEKQFSQVINKNNTGFKVLIISNILILVLLLLNYFFLIS